MKIGVITNALFSHGGVERVTSTVFNELCKTNDVDIIYVGELEYDKEKLYDLNENKIKIIRKEFKIKTCERLLIKMVKIINNRTGFFNNRKLDIVLEKILYPKSLKSDMVTFLNNNYYDVVIAIQGENSLMLASIANQINAKTIGWQHNSYEAYYFQKYKYSWKKDSLAKSILPRLNKIVVLTDEDKQKYEQHMNIDTVRIYNPLSFNSKEKTMCNTNNIISVGRLVEQKGFDLLIKAFSLIASKYPQIKLKIIGEGQDKQKLNELIEFNHLNERVEIKPFTNNIIKEYVDSDFFISSSRWEGFGLVITEAMECGLPVISFKTDGPREIIKNGVNGYLVNNDDIEGLALAMETLLRHNSKKLQYSKAAINRAKDFNIKNIVYQWENILKYL